MYKTARHIFMLMGALTVAACATDSESAPTDWGNDTDAVRIAAAVSTPTRTNPEATDVALQQAFVTGDIMEVSATDGTTTETVDYQYSESQWQPTGTNYLAWHKKWTSITFNAFYPADGINTFANGHIYADQTTAAKMSASDYMKASKTYTERPSDRLLRLDMLRQTSRLILRIKRFGTQFDADQTVDHVRIVSNDLTTTTSSQPITISPLQNGEGAVNTTYTALVAPGASKVSVYFTNDPAEQPLSVNTGNLDRGTSYTYDLVVGKDKIEIDGVTINNWEDGNDIGGGKTTEEHDYITFTANAEQTFKITQPYNSISLNLEYSVNNGEWMSYAIGESITFGGTNGTLRLRGINAEGTANTNSFSTIQFSNDTPVACSGDIRTLVDYRTKDPNTQKARFLSLFNNCTQLTTAPQLPATTLADICYKNMFSGCTSLTQAPELPATTLADNCYYSMFYNCTALKQAPKLPATTLAEYCYNSMFNGCTSLTQAPELPATTLANNCYNNMFYKCTALKQAPKLPATTLAEYCYYSMFGSCSSLTQAPELPAMTLAKNCYYRMFYECTKLEQAPTLPASTLANSCYHYMFNGCTSLTQAPELPAMTLANNCYDSMFYGCTSLTQAPELPATTLAEYCYNSMFNGCTSLTQAPELPATTLIEYCYSYIFNGCTKLSTVTMMAPSDKISRNSFLGWLYNAGTDVTSRTLKVKDKAAYDGLKAFGTYHHPNKWRISGGCKVIDADGNEITE